MTISKLHSRPLHRLRKAHKVDRSHPQLSVSMKTLRSAQISRGHCLIFHLNTSKKKAHIYQSTLPLKKWKRRKSLRRLDFSMLNLAEKLLKICQKLVLRESCRAMLTSLLMKVRRMRTNNKSSKKMTVMKISRGYKNWRGKKLTRTRWFLRFRGNKSMNKHQEMKGISLGRDSEKRASLKARMTIMSKRNCRKRS